VNPISHIRRPAALLAAALAFSSAACRLPAQAADSDLPLATFAYDASAPLELRDSLLRVEDGVQVRAISYASPKGGRATGLLFVPEAGGRNAGVVMMHGAPGSASRLANRAVYVARHGAVVIAIDAPFARRGGQPLTFTPADSADQVQLIVDLQRAVDVLRARADVDPARLAYVGTSFGGAMGVLFAGVERRIATYVLAVADGGIVTHFTNRDGSRVAPLAEMPAEQWDRWRAAMDPIEPARFVGRIAPASVLFQSARRDQMVAADDSEALHAAFTGTKEVKWYDSAHALPAAASVDQLHWLHRTVGTTPVTEADLAGPRPMAPPTATPAR
jgi:dienelactone hydrolase